MGFLFTIVKTRRLHQAYGRRIPSQAVDLDKTDRDILAALQEDARISMRELSRRTGVSTPTAGAKVRRLEALGLIRGYRAVIDPQRLGRADYLVEAEAAPAEARALADRLRGATGVEEVLETAGGRLFVRYLARGHDALQRFLHELSGMKALRTYRVHPVLAEHGGTTPLVDESTTIDVPCHLCSGPIHGAGIHKRLVEAGRERDHWFCCRNCAAQFERRLDELSRAAAENAR